MIDHDTVVTYVGVVRVYFNRHSDAPRVWCVADEKCAWELCVVQVIVQAGVQLVSMHDPEAAILPDHAGPVRAWLQGAARLHVDADGTATLWPAGTT